jgi:Cyclic nucleotide-binding domain
MAKLDVSSTLPKSTELSKANLADEAYRVWASDNQVYGPIRLPVLQGWVAEGRVLRDTWVYLEFNQEWRLAGVFPALLAHFPAEEGAEPLPWQPAAECGVGPEELRQFAVMSSLSKEELTQLIRFGDLRLAEAGEVIIRRDEPGDALFFVLAGSVRARILVGGEEKVLAHIAAGEFFGDMAMFTQSLRSADVVADQEARLLRFSAEAFRLLITERPAAAAPMLFAIASTMAHRILEDNRRFQKEVAAEFVWR